MSMQVQIQRSQHIQPSFLVGGTRYNLLSSSWKQQKFRTQNQAIQKFLNLEQLSYTILKNSLYSLTPLPPQPLPPPSQQPPSNPPPPPPPLQSCLISYNFVTEEIKEWKTQEEPLFRTKYAINCYEGRICVFGGVFQGKYFNDLISYCSYSNMWIPVEKPNSKISPEPRIPYVFQDIGNGNLLVFGGRNQKGILKDAYLLVDLQWRELAISDNENIQMNLGHIQQVTQPQGIRFASVKNSIYFFGGFNGKNFLNDFYQLTISENNNSIIITKIENDCGPRPCPRAYHTMQKLGENCFAVFGGTNGVTALRDLCVFDTLHKKWIQIFPLNGPLPMIGQAKMYFYSHSLHLIGLLNEKNSMKKGMIQVTFPQFQIIKSQICSNCIKRLQTKQRDEYSAPKKPFISNGLLHNMSMQLSFPFQALSLLLDCTKSLQSTQIQISNKETSNKLSYLDIRFNGKQLTRQQYYSIISHSYIQDQLVLEVIDKLKLGALRLGKTLIYCHLSGGMRRVFLFSADGLIISHYHQLYAYLAYEERISDEWLSTQESINHKKFIINLLQSYFDNPTRMLNQITSHCLLIFESNVLMTTQKIYYGELISTQNDITLCKSNKKVQFLDSIGFKLSEDPEVSLSKYLQILYLDSNIKNIKVQNKNIQLQKNSYINTLQNLQKSFKLKSLCKDRVTVGPVEAEVYLYQVLDPSKYDKDIYGILLYNKNRLINRFDVQFGDLFWNKFYKTKYKKSFGIWQFAGVIVFHKGVENKTLCNQFKNDCNFNGFIRHIRKEILGKVQTVKLGHRDDKMEAEQQVKVNKASRRQR